MKNLFCARDVYKRHQKPMKTIGIVSENKEKKGLRSREPPSA